MIFMASALSSAAWGRVDIARRKRMTDALVQRRLELLVAGDNSADDLVRLQHMLGVAGNFQPISFMAITASVRLVTFSALGIAVI